MTLSRNLSRHTASIFVVLLCMAVVGGLWIALFLQLELDSERIVDSKRRENDNLARLFAEQVTRTIRGAEVIMKEIGDEYSSQGTAFNLAKYWKESSLHLDPANGIAVLNENGDLMLSSNAQPGPANYRNTDIFRGHLEDNSDKLHINKPVRGRVTGKWTVYLSRRLSEPDGSFGGIVLYGLDPTYFSGVFAKMELGPNAIAGLMDLDGVVLARQSDGEFSAGQDVSSAPLFRKLLPAARYGNFVRKSMLDGVTRIFSYRELDDFPLIVTIGTSEAAALANHEVRKAGYVLAGGGISAVVLTLSVFVLFMIRRANAEIRAVNADLERRVRERTDALRQAQSELVRKERLAALGQLSASVSHELRNPLGAISTSTAILRARLGEGDPTVLRSIDRIRRSVDRCDRIIGEMLDYARDHALRASPTNVDEWLKDLVAEQGAPAEIQLALDLNLNGAKVEIDSELFRRAIINLYSNACDAMMLDRRPDATRADKTLRIETRRKGESAEIVIADNGPGMLEDVLAGSFEPLFSTKNFGVGLGLPIVKQILEQHHGQINVENRPGKGVRMVLTLPLKQPEAESLRTT